MYFFFGKPRFQVKTDRMKIRTDGEVLRDLVMFLLAQGFRDITMLRKRYKKTQPDGLGTW